MDMKRALFSGAIGTVVFAATSEAGLLVEPVSAEAHFEWTALREPGPAASNSRWRDFDEPGWIGVWGGFSTNGETYTNGVGAGMHAGFFSSTNDVVGNTIDGKGDAYSEVMLTGDDGQFTTMTGITRTRMYWRVTDPVRFRLSADMSLGDITLSSGSIASAEVGILLSGAGMYESAVLESFSESTLTVNWTMELGPGLYRLESWANSFAFTDQTDALISSTASYSFVGEFLPVPGPPILASGVIALWWRTRRHRS